VVSGLVTAVVYRWGSSWAVGTLTPYMQSLATGSPTTVLVEELPFLARLHTLSWFAILLLLPLTSASLVIVAVIHRILMAIARPVDAMAGAGRRAMTRLSPARWLWPEEDAVELVVERDNAHEPS
jgi:nitrate reductase gamma subunit